MKKPSAPAGFVPGDLSYQDTGRNRRGKVLPLRPACEGDDTGAMLCPSLLFRSKHRAAFNYIS